MRLSRLIAFLIALLASVWVVAHHSTSHDLLRDSDTAFLLKALEKRDAPLSWFGTDWPLENHFYRPVSTLIFEFDFRNSPLPSGGEGLGVRGLEFGRTNAILAALCVLALFWLLSELLGKALPAAFGALIFAAWSVDALAYREWAYWLALVPLLAAFLPGRKIKPALAGTAFFLFTASEFHREQALRERIIEWIPGRTASSMTLFALLCLAAYVRSERLSSNRESRAPTPLDPPATKGTIASVLDPVKRWPWLSFSVVCLVLAFGCYEQAVMLPALLLGSAVALRLGGLRVVWWAHSLFWGTLLGYLALRYSILGAQPSGYQKQQFRNGPDVYFSILDYLLPAARTAWQTAHSWSDWTILILPSFYERLLFIGINLFVFWQVIRGVQRRDKWAILALSGLLLSTLAYLPMAWLHHFDHYHYLPMSLRTLFLIGLGGMGGAALVSAASLPARQAPPRRDPAPGSLPRR